MRFLLSRWGWMGLFFLGLMAPSLEAQPSLDQALLQRAWNDWEGGRRETAMAGFARFAANQPEDTWSVVASLVCEAKSLKEDVARLSPTARSSHHPYKDQTCYRILRDFPDCKIASRTATELQAIAPFRSLSGESLSGTRTAGLSRKSGRAAGKHRCSATCGRRSGRSGPRSGKAVSGRSHRAERRRPGYRPCLVSTGSRQGPVPRGCSQQSGNHLPAAWPLPGRGETLAFGRRRRHVAHQPL